MDTGNCSAVTVTILHLENHLFLEGQIGQGLSRFLPIGLGFLRRINLRQPNLDLLLFRRE
ncbi:hypothetical protein D3C72_2497230 [compost metagenome]